MIKKLFAFLQEGFQDPVQIIRYLQSRQKCSKAECYQKGCGSFIRYFSGPRPWDKDGLDNFFEWAWRWYPREYEVPINAVFTLPWVARFLELEMG